MGFLPTYATFDPTLFLLTNPLSKLLVPSDEEIASSPPLEIRGEKMGLQACGEMDEIHPQFANFWTHYKDLGITPNTKRLSTRQLGDGIATTQSYEDGFISPPLGLGT
jgi:hypothetical protein